MTNNIDDAENDLEILAEKHADNPALQEAYDQILVIRKLMGYKGLPPSENKKGPRMPWEERYFEIVAESEFDAFSPQVIEAWSKYEMLRKLLDDK